jgi:N utilization substance protein A
MEVPDGADGVGEIRAVSREAGARSKVAVVSKDKNVDPVGACVGIKGSRIQSIIRELHGEKIDVIPFAENVETLLTSALQPAKIAQVVLAAENKQATVIVQDDQLALAIGKNGQNVRLASKLLGWKVDIVPHSKNQEEMRRRAEEAFLKTAPALDKIPGITANLAKKLQEAGYDSVAKFLGKTADQLTEIQGIGPKTAEKIMESLNPYLPHPAESRPAERTAAELFANLGGHEAAAPKPKEMAAGDLFANFDQAAAATEPRTEAPAEVQTEAPAETRERAPRKSRSDAPAGEGGEAV